MRPEYRAKTLVVEIDQSSYAALRAEAQARSTTRRVTLADIVRDLIAEHLENAKITGVLQ
jgi:hypothetical protein